MNEAPYLMLKAKLYLPNPIPRPSLQAEAKARRRGTEALKWRNKLAASLRRIHAH